MGVNTRYFPSSDMNCITLQSFLVSVYPDLVTSIDSETNSLIVTINDRLSFRFRNYKTGNWNFDIYYSIDGVETYATTQRTAMTLVAIITPTYFSFVATGGYDGDRCYLIWESIDNRLLLATGHNWNTSTTSPYYATLTDVDDSSTYNHLKLLNYNAGVGYIDYIDGDMVVSSNNRAFIDTNFKACSNMTAGTVITINGQNYYTVDTNAIMPMS